TAVVAKRSHTGAQAHQTAGSSCHAKSVHPHRRGDIARRSSQGTRLDCRGSTAHRHRTYGGRSGSARRQGARDWRKAMAYSLLLKPNFRHARPSHYSTWARHGTLTWGTEASVAG